MVENLAIHTRVMKRGSRPDRSRSAHRRRPSPPGAQAEGFAAFRQRWSSENEWHWPRDTHLSSETSLWGSDMICVPFGGCALNRITDLPTMNPLPLPQLRSEGGELLAAAKLGLILSSYTTPWDAAPNLL
jgi:hypothetical protein